jgi:excinuclease ABC subunit C
VIPVNYPDDELREQVEVLPSKPGVYMFRDAEEKVLYVGKARNLRKRVRSYFRSAKSLTRKSLLLVNRIASLDYIVTDNEVEALILENNLIKKYRPRYNVRLRDDKQYPYIKVTDEKWPRVLVVREIEDDGGDYYGPYTNATAMRATLRTLRRVFPYRTCSNRRLEREGRPCLYYHIGRCLGPCDDRCDEEEYVQLIQELERFLQGRTDELMKRLKQQMREASEALAFEEAAEYRDRLQALESVLERQKIVSAQLQDQDVIGFARRDDEASVVVLFVREGKLVGREHFMLTGAAELPDEELMAAFLKQYYTDAALVPQYLLLQVAVAEEATIQEWLSGLRGKKAYLRVPQRGEKRRLVELAHENAEELLGGEVLKRKHRYEQGESAVEELQSYLQLPEPPQRMECYDISNLQGTDSVGSMVVFVDGRPDKSEYRRFKLRTVEGSDDFASLQEVLYRRFKRGLQEREELSEKGHAAAAEAKFAQFPDLIVIDGGKGQLSAALEVLETLNLDHIPVFGLAKREEELFAPERSEPLAVPRDSDALQLLQRLRDEAHRFAVKYHRKLRQKRSIKSELDDIRGIGEKRRVALLKHFGSLDNIRSASVEELAAVPGMNSSVAERVASELQKRGETGENVAEKR